MQVCKHKREASTQRLVIIVASENTLTINIICFLSGVGSLNVNFVALKTIQELYIVI